jgi:hypothetical protein
MTKRLMPLLVLAFPFFTLACGGDGKKSKRADGAEKTIPFLSFSVSDQSALPSCTSKIVGALAYVSSEKKFVYCNGTEWLETEVGAQGPKAQRVREGRKGPQGLLPLRRSSVLQTSTMYHHCKAI